MGSGPAPDLRRTCAGPALAPLAFSVYQATMVLGRAVGDRCVRASGAANVVRAGGAIAAAGLIGVVAAPSPYLAIGAFAVTGLVLTAVIIALAPGFDPARVPLAGHAAAQPARN